MVKLVATSVIRGSSRGESHGGIYIVDLDAENIYQPVDWKKTDIDWRGQGHGRGLRGIATHRDRVFVAASDELHEYNPDFELVGSYQNPYLKFCHEISVHEHHIFITSADFDSIIAFNLRKNAFDMGFMLRTDGRGISMKRFDPTGDDGPLPMNKFHINSVFCDKGGMYVAGQRTDALLLYNGKRIGVSTTLPAGTHNARPFREGILFNDTESNAVRYATPDGRADCAFSVPLVAEDIVSDTQLDDSRIARQGFGQGLCSISNTVIAAGSSPSTISLCDLDKKETVSTVNISTDVRQAIHSLAVWPYY